jgi:hypothetical protein
MFIEFKDKEIKQLVHTVKQREKKEGRTIADVLCDIIYGDDPRSAIEGISLYLGTLMDSDLGVDEIEKMSELREVIPFKRKDDPTTPEGKK